MFDFLNKLSHDHSNPAQQQAEKMQIREQKSSINVEIRQSASEILENKQQRNFDTVQLDNISERRKLKHSKSIGQKSKIVSKVAQLQKGNLAELQPQTMNLLKDMLAKTELHVPDLAIQTLNKLRLGRQKKVYLREMSKDQGEYLKEVNEQTKIRNYYLKQELSDTINGVINQITSEICEEKFNVNLRKVKIQQIQKFVEPSSISNITKLAMIKMQQSELNDKIGELKVDFMQESMNQLDVQARQIVDKDSFNFDSEKNKKAEEFIKEKQKERQDKMRRDEEKKQKKRQEEERKREEHLALKKFMKQRKHDSLVQKFNLKKKQKNQEQQRVKKEKGEYNSFLKEFKKQKPLFVQKEQQHKLREKKQNRQKFKKLQQIQSLHEPLNMQHIVQHEERYLQLKREDRDRKQAEVELAKQEQNMRSVELNEKVYKGKYRYMLLQEMVEKKQKEKQKKQEKKMQQLKKQAYSMDVKERYKPTIDQSKREEVERLKNTNQKKKRKYLTPNRVAYSEQYSTIGSKYANYSEGQVQTDPTKQGKKYHRLFKQYIRQKISKGQVKQKDENIKSSHQTIEPRTNYLIELRQKYSNRIKPQTERLERQIENMKKEDDFTSLFVKAEQFDKKAKRRQKKLKHASHKPEEERQLEEDMLCAIKAKMSLINNIK